MKLQITLLLALASKSLGAMEGPKHAVNFFTRKIAEYQADLTQVRELKAANLVVRESCNASLGDKPNRFIMELLSSVRRRKQPEFYRGSEVLYEPVCCPDTIIRNEAKCREATIGEMLANQFQALEVEERTISDNLKKLEALRTLANAKNE